MSLLRFDHFLLEHGKAGARDRFEDFVVATVKSVRPSARPIRANPGDWGIDAYIGSLADGDIGIWQAKYFPGVFGDGQKDQVRESYASAKKSAAKHGYRILTWTLCIPQDLDGPAQQWWDTWEAAAVSADGITIELWNLTELDRPPFRGHVLS